MMWQFVAVQSPLLAQSGHGVVRCTCLLLTQSRHWRSQFNASEAARLSLVAGQASFDSCLKSQLH